jgi:hypothetical protein
MTPTLEQSIAAEYITAGAGEPTPEGRRLARAMIVRNVVRSLYEADKKFGLDTADHGSLAELVDAAEEHLDTVSRHAGDFAAKPAQPR